MHCPSCGQQQISSETKFCSRCGLPLIVIAEVLFHGGYLPQLAQLNKKRRRILSRRNGLGFSLIWFLFFLLIMAPFWGIVDVEELAGVSAVVGIFGGLIMMVSSFIFLEKDSAAINQGFYSAQPRDLTPHPGYGALPAQQSVPVSAYAVPQSGNWRDTNDLVPSVTEGTTKLLEKEDL